MAQTIDRVTRSETLSQRAYSSIRRAIRDGILVQGERYSENELAEQIGVSRTPIREALIQLSRERLVEILPQRGFQIRTPGEVERDEVFGLRLAIETFAVDRLARAATARDVGKLRRIVEQQRKVADDATRFLELDEQFHLLMPELAGLRHATQFLTELRGLMWLFSNIALSAVNRTTEVLAEHGAIVDAIAAKDPEAAQRTIGDHIRATSEMVSKQLP